MNRFLASLRRFEQISQSLPNAIGPFAAAAVQENIRDFSSPANAPLTRKLKGDKGPLKDSGELLASINYVTRGDLVLVGTNKIYARLLNEGGVIRPKRAKKLTIPTTRQIKRWVEIRGVRRFLDGLKNQGWSIVWRDKSVIGTAPRGVRGVGIKLNQNSGGRNGGKKSYLLFYRKDQVTVPERRFMQLTATQKRELRGFARQRLREALR